MTLVRFLPLVCMLAACSPDEALTASTQALASDSADRACQIVLRQVGRVPNGRGGYQTSASGSWIWEGTLDVAAQGLPSVQYHYGSDPTWWQVDAVVDDVTPDDGFIRYRFRLEDHLPGPGMSGTSLSRARIQLIPVLVQPDGSRAFDHNRNAGDFDSYELTAAGSFSVADDPTVCSAGAVLSFDASWNQAQDGAIVPGGTLLVSYALERLPSCRGTHNGYPAWDVVAHARFSPGGELVQASLRAFETVNGIPTTVAHAIPARFDVPAGATHVELWFENFGLWCQAWDSSYGENYRFAVAP